MSKIMICAGSLTFGAVDPTFALSPSRVPLWFPLISTDYWEVNQTLTHREPLVQISVFGFKVNDKWLSLCATAGQTTSESSDAGFHHRISKSRGLSSSFLRYEQGSKQEEPLHEAPEEMGRTSRRVPAAPPLAGASYVSPKLNAKLKPGYCRAAIDTGSSLITMPNAMLRVLLNSIDGTKPEMQPQVLNSRMCKEKSQFPKISVILEDINERLIEFELDANDVLIEEDDLSEPLKADGHGEEKCVIGIFPLDIPPPRGPLIVLGNTFIRKYYSIFDRDHLTVGFLRADHSQDDVL